MARPWLRCAILKRDASGPQHWQHQETYIAARLLARAASQDVQLCADDARDVRRQIWGLLLRAPGSLRHGTQKLVDDLSCPAARNAPACGLILQPVDGHPV